MCVSDKCVRTWGATPTPKAESTGPPRGGPARERLAGLKHFLCTREATALQALEEVALPTTRCVAQPGRRAGRGGGRGQGRVGEEEGEGGRPLGPRTQLPGTSCRCHIGPGPSPSHLMSCHSPQGRSPALKREGEDREGGRRPPKHRQPGWELPLSQGLVPWPQ